MFTVKVDSLSAVTMKDIGISPVRRVRSRELKMRRAMAIACAQFFWLGWMPQTELAIGRSAVASHTVAPATPPNTTSTASTTTGKTAQGVSYRYTLDAATLREYQQSNESSATTTSTSATRSQQSHDDDEDTPDASHKTALSSSADDKVEADAEANDGDDDDDDDDGDIEIAESNNVCMFDGGDVSHGVCRVVCSRTQTARVATRRAVAS
jgi:hypothetical protein